MKKSLLILALITGLIVVLITKNKQETQSKPIGLKIYPPNESKVTSPGIAKFIIFTRESLSEKDWHHSANALEFDPHQLPFQLVRSDRWKRGDYQDRALVVHHHSESRDSRRRETSHSLQSAETKQLESYSIHSARSKRLRIRISEA
ncbi:MAG: hypothetical protein ACJA16_000334 [Akkermansiaceae bacterium]|jgi:hypothetical protein